MSKELIIKLQKGEALTEQEKAAFASFDLDTLLNGAAAGARKDAEAKAQAKLAEFEATKAELEALKQAQAADGAKKKPEAERAQAAIDALQKQVKEMQDKLANESKEKAELARSQKINELISSIQLTDKVDPTFKKLAIKAAFEGVTDEELSNPAVMKTHIDKFVQSNPALIVDPSKGGTGNPPRQTVQIPAPGSTEYTRSQVVEITKNPAEYAKHRDAIAAARTAGTIKDA